METYVSRTKNSENRNLKPVTTLNLNDSLLYNSSIEIFIGKL